MIIYSITVENPNFASRVTLMISFYMNFLNRKIVYLLANKTLAIAPATPSAPIATAPPIAASFNFLASNCSFDSILAR